MKEGRIPDEQRFLNAVFAVVEHLTTMELRTTSKKLIINYINESKHLRLIDRARVAVKRYSLENIPSLEEIRQKPRGELTMLDHLVLKMEYEAKQLDGQ